ncbi:MAG: flagellar biosynthesis protein FlgE [Desulfovibrio sp. MES5]|uniref:flagellar hook protein FlgE n=1 Tax=Desulfovibrio sp. MES5 TaxID=1899016 RepID=UPI000B9D0C4F|nr:flagellar hook protein FlgE [Desulfovibrio sp. MES5]OXS28645.1 MAG: flagellar biosynthesis protein FlgE [Desulfovibrio sp. MES5]
MGLSASMWTSVSGLLTHGQKMNVVGNNIANVSTLGFKSQRMDFNDYLYRGIGTTSGTSQIGAGAGVYAILGDFSQGSLETTNSATDLAIDGNGFFQVRKPNSEQMYYSRAGDFYFNKSRELQNPEGYLLQGWKVNNEKKLTFNNGATNLGSDKLSKSAYVGSGTPTDIVLDSWNIVPQQTTNVTFTMGLTNDGTGDRTTSSTSPMTALFDLWDGTSNPPMADTAYATQSSIDVYDEGGGTHTMTVYYDQVDTTKTDSNGNTIYNIKGLPAGYTVYEYLVTIPPSQDNRSFGGTGYNEATNTWTTEPTKFYNDPTAGTNKNAGVLMSGVMIFNASGQLVNQTAYTYGATETPAANDQVAVDPSLKSSWQPTKVSSNGLPVFSANFTGQPLANSVSETLSNGGGTPVSQVQNYITELDFGLKSMGTPTWTNNTTSLADLAVHSPTPPATTPPPYVDYSNVPIMGNAQRQEYASVANTTSYTVQNRTQDGYASGTLSNVSIDNSGVVHGVYSNGKTLPLYQIAMYDFQNYQGLYREGGNLFSATNDSGEPRLGVAGDNGFGTTRAYNIEQSNVDMTTEFVQMISTQRGFQANSKGITTVDTMLETVIGMKR